MCKYLKLTKFIAISRKNKKKLNKIYVFVVFFNAVAQIELKETLSILFKFISNKIEDFSKEFQIFVSLIFVKTNKFVFHMAGIFQK